MFKIRKLFESHKSKRHLRLSFWKILSRRFSKVIYVNDPQVYCCARHLIVVLQNMSDCDASVLSSNPPDIQIKSP